VDPAITKLEKEISQMRDTLETLPNLERLAAKREIKRLEKNLAAKQGLETPGSATPLSSAYGSPGVRTVPHMPSPAPTSASGTDGAVDRMRKQLDEMNASLEQLPKLERLAAKREIKRLEKAIAQKMGGGGEESVPASPMSPLVADTPYAGVSPVSIAHSPVPRPPPLPAGPTDTNDPTIAKLERDINTLNASLASLPKLERMAAKRELKRLEKALVERKELSPMKDK
jgi:TolA-binding protein